MAQKDQPDDGQWIDAQYDNWENAPRDPPSVATPDPTVESLNDGIVFRERGNPKAFLYTESPLTPSEIRG